MKLQPADREYTYTTGEEDKEFVIASMKNYVDKEQKLDKFLRSLIVPLVKGAP